MKNISPVFLLLVLLISSCTSQKKLAYLNNIPEKDSYAVFPMEIPNYKIQPRDILYITVKAMTPDGSVVDFLSPSRTTSGSYYMQNESSQYLFGYDVDKEGKILLPVIGSLTVGGLTLEETRNLLQSAASKIFNGSTVECKLLSFKFTVIGEVKSPGTYFNYNNYLTVFEAIGRAGGIGDYGKRNRIMVIRPFDKETKVYSLNLQDKNILSSEAYFLLPNDVIIVEPESKKVFSLNLPTISFIVTSLTSVVTSTLLIMNYFGK